MRKLIGTLVVLALLASVAVAPAQASGSLSGATAFRYAKRAAVNRVKRQPGIVDWDIARGFKFTSRKWVFVWYAQMQDGSICAAQLVTRYASLKSSKVIAYFRQEQCS
jgi:hypothetical protein